MFKQPILIIFISSKDFFLFCCFNVINIINLITVVNLLSVNVNVHVVGHCQPHTRSIPRRGVQTTNPDINNYSAKIFFLFFVVFFVVFMIKDLFKNLRSKRINNKTLFLSSFPPLPPSPPFLLPFSSLPFLLASQFFTFF